MGQRLYSRNKGLCNAFALNYKKKPFLGVVLIPEIDELWISNGQNVGAKKNHVNRKLNSFPNKSLLR